MVEASPRKIYANAHTYHVNSISVNSDDETYLSADDLRINLWSLQRTDQSFSKIQIAEPFCNSSLKLQAFLSFIIITQNETQNIQNNQHIFSKTSSLGKQNL